MSYQNQKGAGYYDRPLSRLVRTLNDSNSYAAKDYTWSPTGAVYFAHLEQGQSSEVEVDGRMMTKTTVTIEIRGWPDLNILDKLEDKMWNETYWLTSISRGNDTLNVKGFHY
jgi:hypothetical protein